MSIVGQEGPYPPTPEHVEAAMEEDGYKPLPFELRMLTQPWREGRYGHVVFTDLVDGRTAGVCTVLYDDIRDHIIKTHNAAIGKPTPGPKEEQA
jgi:hypothetical protein